LNLCVLIAGVFFGIWMDYSTWHNMVAVPAVGAAAQDIHYELVDGNEALLLVHPGDTITLEPEANAAKANNPKMAFKEKNPPCTPYLSGNSEVCNIVAKPTPGPYHFTCSSGGGDTCDPGIQQSGSAGGIKGLGYMDLGYMGAVKRDFAHLFGM